jgi:hypothetical protein
MPRVYTVEIKCIDDTGRPHKICRDLSILAPDLDKAKQELKKVLQDNPQWPPLRSLNVSAKNAYTLLAYLQPTSATVPPTNIDFIWRKPQGPKPQNLQDKKTRGPREKV